MPEPTVDPVDPTTGSEPGPDSGTAPERLSAARRIWAALSHRPSRSQLIAAGLLALLGYAATVQIQLTSASNNFTGQQRSDLVELLDSLSGASDRAEQQISALQNTRDELQNSSSARATALAEARKRLQDLEILAGTIPATGPGVTVTIEDPAAAVTAPSLLNGIEELRDAGAEAIQVNDVRVVASTWFGGTPGALTVDGHGVRAPYVIKAIGSAHTLSDAVGFRGGLSDEIASLGGKVVVQENSAVDITALHPAEQPQYSQPTGP